MSDDVISRLDAIEAIASRDETNGTVKVFTGRQVNEILASLPTAEPKTGEWIIATGMMPPEFHCHHCCSECGNFANMEPPFGNREDLSKFCPHCGAKMVREDGEA